MCTCVIKSTCFRIPYGLSPPSSPLPHLTRRTSFVIYRPPPRSSVRRVSPSGAGGVSGSAAGDRGYEHHHNNTASNSHIHAINDEDRKHRAWSRFSSIRRSFDLSAGGGDGGGYRGGSGFLSGVASDDNMPRRYNRGAWRASRPNARTAADGGVAGRDEPSHHLGDGVGAAPAAVVAAALGGGRGGGEPGDFAGSLIFIFRFVVIIFVLFSLGAVMVTCIRV